MTLREIGFESQFKLFELAKKITGEVPAVVDAEDLLIDAGSVVKQYCEKVGIPFLPESLTWEPEFKQEWKDWEMWHLDAGDSTGFQKDMEDFGYTVDDVPELREMYDKCQPLYEKMYAERLTSVTSLGAREGARLRAPSRGTIRRRPRPRSAARQSAVNPSIRPRSCRRTSVPRRRASSSRPSAARLVDLVVHDPDERAALLERAQNLPVVPLSLRAQYDLEMLAVGAFSPLDRFMAHDEYESVLYEMRLEGGELFPIPLAVPCREEVLRGHPREIALSDEQGAILALLEVDEVYPADILREMRAVLGGRDSAHPLVIEAKGWPSHYLAGRPRVFDLPRHRLHGPMCLTPAELRARLAAMGNSTVVAFQTRNPMHRIHEELTKRALKTVGGTLLIHPAVGVTRPQDVAAARSAWRPTRSWCATTTIPSNTLLSLMPLAMRFAGPREAVWHAIIRRNYGATHLIVGRDHAGPGPDSHGRAVLRALRRAGHGRALLARDRGEDHLGAGARLPHRRGPLRGAQRGPRTALASRPSRARRCARSTWPRARSCPSGSPVPKSRRSCSGRTRRPAMRRPAPDGRTRLSLPSRRDLLHDLVAGLTVGASQVGNAMAYTMLAGRAAGPRPLRRRRRYAGRGAHRRVAAHADGADGGALPGGRRRARRAPGGPARRRPVHAGRAHRRSHARRSASCAPAAWCASSPTR